MDYSKEIEGKCLHDPLFNKNITPISSSCICSQGPIIIGAGPSGLAVAACLKQRGIPSLILERANCIASLWKLKTYDRLRLHLPKEFCELPLMPIPHSYPTYPNRKQFVAYLEEYADHFGLDPAFNKTVVNAEFDQRFGFWRVTALGPNQEKTEYLSQWLIVATGENAEEIVPQIEGMDDFGGSVLHSSSYKSGQEFGDKDVLVVGCGNSGMEVCLDLANHNARPSLVVRDSVHVLPHQIIGRSTFGLSMWLLKWFPISLVDRFLLLVCMLVLGDTGKLGINRPQIGPLQLKLRCGKTPVLDVGTIAKIRSGNIKVWPGIKRVIYHGVEFVDGRQQNFDAILLATGFRSNVADWLKEEDMFSEKDGFPRKQFPNGWKGERGLYAVGFTRRGLMGASFDAKRVAEDIEFHWIASGTKNFAFNSPMPNKS